MKHLVKIWTLAVCMGVLHAQDVLAHPGHGATVRDGHAHFSPWAEYGGEATLVLLVIAAFGLYRLFRRDR